MPTLLSLRRTLGALVTCAAIVACEESTAPDAERIAILEVAQIPTDVVPPASFDIVASYWRGACETARRRIVRDPSGIRVTVFQQAASPARGDACIALVYRDTVAVRIDAPYTLPFTVRWQRGGLPDTVIVVRRRG